MTEEEHEAAAPPALPANLTSVLPLEGSQEQRAASPVPRAADAALEQQPEAMQPPEPAEEAALT